MRSYHAPETPAAYAVAELDAERVGAHVNVVPVAVGGTALAALFLASVEWQPLGLEPVALWLVLLIPPLLCRIAVAAAYRRAPDVRSPARWLWMLRAGYVMQAAAWGIAGVLLFPDDVPHQGFLAFTVGGIAASSITVTAFDLTAALSFLAIALVPLIGRLLLEPGELPKTMAAAMVLFLAFMAVNASRASRQWSLGVRLRRRASGRAEQLARYHSVLNRLRSPAVAQTTEALQTTIVTTVQALDLDWIELWLVDGGGRLHREASYTRAGVDASAGEPTQPDRATIDRLENAPFASLDVGAGTRIDLPLRAGSRLDGLLRCHSLIRRTWSEDEVAMLNAVASILAGALEERRRQAAEAALRHVNDNLERLVEERTSALKASQERLAYALEATNDGVWDFDVETGAVHYSPVWARLLGYEPHEVPQSIQTFWSHLHPEDLARTEAVMRRQLTGDVAAKELEIRLRRKDGTYRWFLDRGKVVERAGDGAARRMVGTIADITTQKTAVEALRESEERFRAVFDKSPIVIALISVDEDRIVEANAAACVAFGFTREEGLGHTSLELRLWVDEEERARVIERLRTEGAITGLDVHMRRRDGSQFWALLNSSVVTIGGRPYRLTTLQDVTVQKHALEALRESDERFRGVFDKGPVVVTLVDLAESRVAEMNELGLRTFGYTREEAIGRTTFELNLWADEEARRQAARQLVHGGVVSSFEIRLRRKNGEEFLALLNSSRVTLGGEPYSLNTLQDITERRRLESQVAQAQKMEVLGHLAGGVAHDFNNVLTVIRSTAELTLQSARVDRDVGDALESIRDASARAAGLTGQLLAFSRRQILRPAVIDVGDVLRDLIPMLRRAVGEPVVFTAEIAAEPATVLADRSSIEQVILNLVINARDAMPRGGPVDVSVRVERGATATSGRVVLVVADGGVGMSDETRTRVFEPFFTTKEVGKGTGLGLSTVHGIVAQSDGTIAVDSEPGRGSRFTVYLPLVEREPARSTPTGDALVRGHETILVVDDDPDILNVVSRALSAAGYHVLVAGGGAEALEVLAGRAGGVRLLLTDVVMPGICGRVLAERVLQTYPSVRVLLSSGFVDASAQADGGLADVPFIAKPYSLKALTQKVREVLDA